MYKKWRSTTILAIRKNNKVVLCGDGQVSFGNTVIKTTSQKVKRIAENKIIVGFAGSASDGMALLDRLEMKLNQYANQLMRACIELAKDWRTDKFLRRLEAMLIVADAKNIFIVSGSGDVLEPEHGVAGIGSGGNYAVAAARALIDTDMDPVDIAKKAMGIAADICVFTNNNIITEILEDTTPSSGKSPEKSPSPGDKNTNLTVVPKNELIPRVSGKGITKDDIYDIAAVIAVLSDKTSVEHMVGIIRSIYPQLGSVTRKAQQAVKSLVGCRILKPSKERGIYLSIVDDFEKLKDKKVNLSKIESDVINMIRTLVNKKND